MGTQAAADIRWLTADDVDEFRRFCAMFRRGDVPDPPRATATLAGGVAEILVATVDGEPAGWAVTYALPHVDGTDMILLYDVEVLPAHRRRGIGRALVTEVRRHAVEQRRLKLWLLTPQDNTAAIQLYRSMRPTATADVMFVWAPDMGRQDSVHLGT